MVVVVRRLTVLLVLEAAESGTGRHLRTIAHEFCRRGVDVHVACATRRDPTFRAALDELRSAGAHVEEVDMGRKVRPFEDTLAILHLCRLFRRIRPDVIHLHNSKAGALGRIAAAFAGARAVVYSPHTFAFLDRSSTWRSRFFLLVEWALAPLTDHLVAVSESGRELALRHHLAPPGRATAIPNGLDESLVAARPSRVEAEPGSRRGTIRLGFVGRLELQKAPDRLVDLAAELDRRGLEFELEIIGAGSLLEVCERSSRERRLGARVQFLGRVDDPDPFYRSWDLFVIASTYEGLPYSVLDAMSWELPVVGFDVVGVNDLVVPGLTGYLAAPFRVVEMADHVMELAADPPRRLAMGRSGRERVLSGFRLRQQIGDLLDVYRRLATRQEAVEEDPAVAARDT